MSDSVTLGSYVIDTDATNSTTDGVRLLPFETANDQAGLFVPAVSSAQSEVSFFVHVSASDTDELKTRVDAVVSAVTKGTGDTLIKYGSDTVYSILMASGGYEESSGQTSIQYGELDAVIDCRVVYTRFQPSAGAGSAGSVGNPDGLVGIPTFTVARGPDGRLRVIAQCTFADTDSNDARTNGIVWLREFRPAQSLPDWLPGGNRLRRVDDSCVIQDTGNNNTVGGSAVATVTLIDIGSALNDISELVASVQSSVSISTVEMDADATSAAPRMLTMTGTIDLKTDGASAYDSADTTPSISDSTIQAIINDAYDAALVRVGLARAEVQQLGATFGATEQGSISWQIEGVTADSDVLSWQETIQVRITSNSVYTSNWGGGETQHVGGAGGTATVVHNLSAKRINGDVPYQRPAEVQGSAWQLIDVADQLPRRRLPRSFIGAVGAESATTQQTYSRTYRFFTADGDFTVGGGIEELVAEVFLNA